MKTLYTSDERLKLAQDSLLGLSVGDGFGEQFFRYSQADMFHRLDNQIVPTAPWYFTDDTVMGLAIYSVLRQFGEINPDALALAFADNYQKDHLRGYGGTAHQILMQIGAGKPWQMVSSEVFYGMGSMGNGAAMRAGLIGAYFFDDLPTVVEQARLSAQVTHFHPEGQAGAIGVAVAAALACQVGKGQRTFTPSQFIEEVCLWIPEGETASRTRRGVHVSPETNIQAVVDVLGNGSDIMAPSTVPFTVWVAAHYMHTYEEAIWVTVNGLGDRDTTCAIVGSIVALSAGVEAIPNTWRTATESIYTNAFVSVSL